MLQKENILFGQDKVKHLNLLNEFFLNGAFRRIIVLSVLVLFLSVFSQCESRIPPLPEPIIPNPCDAEALGADNDKDNICDSVDIDDDNDGLIEISTIEELNNIRYNLEGSSYKISANDNGSSLGCPSEGGCIGYELIASIDGVTWEAAGNTWVPVGDTENPLSAVFSGIDSNGGDDYTISNININGDSFHSGLFGVVSGTIRNVTLSNITVSTSSSTVGYAIGAVAGELRGFGALIENVSAIDVSVTTTSAGGGYIGGLVGKNYRGSTIAISNVMNNNDTLKVTGDVGADKVGGLVGANYGGTIVLSFATISIGAGDGADDVGGLLGFNNGTVSNSYATGSTGGVNGEAGNADKVGGLVGYSSISSIIRNSYATGSAVGGDGETDSVGGLVGLNKGIVSNSYATGSTVGGDGNMDSVGGLVGTNAGKISTSYAVASVDGGNGTDDIGGLLVGTNDSGTIVSSYYENGGTVSNVDTMNTNTSSGFGVSSAQLKAAIEDSSIDISSETPCTDAGGNWDATACTLSLDATNNSICTNELNGFWDATSETCNKTVTSISIYEDLAIDTDSDNSPDNWNFGADDQYPTLRSYTEASGAQSTGEVLCNQPGSTDEPATRQSCSSSITSYSTSNEVFVDADNDGLIEISTLDELKNISNSLLGASLEGSALGCVREGACDGYELINNIDGEGSTWEPLGNKDDHFSAKFNGNGYTISNLMIKSESDRDGLFGVVSGTIYNFKLRNISVTTSGFAAGEGDYYAIGSVAGELNGSEALIDNVSAVDVFVATTSNDGGYIGGLLGHNNGGTVSNSYAKASVEGGGGLTGDKIGGLVGFNSTMSSIVRNSYAGSIVDGRGGGTDSVGGLIGENAGKISNSFAIGTLNGGAGDEDYVGGLVGTNTGQISNSYSRTSVDGGDGANDVGGLLVGSNSGTITSSYYDSSFYVIRDALSKEEFNATVAVGGVSAGYYAIDSDINCTIAGGVWVMPTCTLNSATDMTACNTAGGEWDGTACTLNYYKVYTLSGVETLNIHNAIGVSSAQLKGATDVNYSITSTINSEAHCGIAGGIWDSSITACTITLAIVDPAICTSAGGTLDSGVCSKTVMIDDTTTTSSILIYGGWSTNNWNFGTNTQYSTLLSYKEDSTSTATPPDQETGDILCEQDVIFSTLGTCVTNDIFTNKIDCEANNDMWKSDFISCP